VGRKTIISRPSSFTTKQQTLNNARSLTARLFTRKETAQNHCQLGNVGLSVEVIVD